MRAKLRQAVENRWYGRAGCLRLLWPLSLVFRGLSILRRRRQQQRQECLPVPVIIVGNISVGGTGKTPLLIALVRQLQLAGFKPGVISRGYGSATAEAKLVTAESASDEVGDEPLLIAQTAACPVVIGRDRTAAAKHLLTATEVDVILSDDGLQHYQLARDLEVVVVDASRGFGNGLCLPSGPLREPIKRLREVDWVVRNGSQPCSQLSAWSPIPMHLKPVGWRNVKTGETKELDQREWLKEPAYAVAGIGNPRRFFTTLTDLGLRVYCKPFPDHHAYSPEDFAEFHQETVLMTAKDAVKCRAFAKESWWYLDVAAELPDSFCRSLVAQLTQVKQLKSADRAEDVAQGSC